MALPRFTRLLIASLLILSCVGYLSPVGAVSNPDEILQNTASVSASEEQVKDFHSDITFNQDSSIRIKETITYYFPSPRHGIYRKIPTSYKAFSLLRRSTILDLHQVSYYPLNKPNDISRAHETSRDFGYLTIKIGDADETITGTYIYVIDYTLRNAVNYFDDHDELFLNVTGNQWEVPIAQSSARITLPAKPTKWLCYTGPDGTKDSNCTWKQSGDTVLDITSEQSYPTGEGLTVVVALPKDSIKNTTQEQILLAILANLGCLLPLPLGILGFVLWWKFGRDPGPKTIIPQYHAPKDLSPLTAGHLYTQSSQPKHVSAELIDLAIKGYLRIHQLGNKKYEFEKIDKDRRGIRQYQVELLNGLFKSGDRVSSDSLKDKFYTTLQAVNKQVEAVVKESGAFESSSEKLKFIMIFGGVGMFILSAVSLGFTIDWAFTGWSIGAALGSFFIALFGFFMTKRSAKGNERYTELEGIKMYIKTAEQHRIEFHNNPKKAIKTFEELLPYAMIFGLEKQWAKEFQDLYTEQPEWYGGSFHTFNSYTFAQDLGQMNSTMNTIAAPAAASGGSGFSGGGGGGFGGGGGGSW